MADTSLFTLRSRWQEVCREERPDALRVLLLASYTIDPLVPYLGLGLHEAGLPAAVTVGPLNQIVQQLLDDDGEVALQRPDVVVVAPRFEELTGGTDAPGGTLSGWGDELSRIADVALAASERSDFCLVFVLPAVPESRPYGVGDAGSSGGVVAASTLAREALRTRLAGLPNLCLADADEALRAVGSRHAHHPALYRFAKVPYTEDLFACLGEQLSRLLRTRHGRGPQVAVIDADSLLASSNGLSPGEAADALRAPLVQLRRAGVGLGVRGAANGGKVWDALAVELPELLGELVERCALDHQAVLEQLREIAADAAAPLEQLVLLTSDQSLAAEVDAALGAGASVVLADEPDRWLTDLRDAGVFDRLPDVVTNDDRTASRAVVGAAGSGTPAAAAGASLSLADFVAGLDVVVTYPSVQAGDVARVAELVERARNFTLGIRQTAADLADRAPEVVAVAVRDRFGDHGISAAAAMRSDAGTCTVDLFSLSCTVLGREVEDAVLREIVERAARDRCDTVVLRYRPTGHNELAVRFVHDAAARDWSTAAGERIRIRAEQAEG